MAVLITTSSSDLDKTTLSNWTRQVDLQSFLRKTPNKNSQQQPNRKKSSRKKAVVAMEEVAVEGGVAVEAVEVAVEAVVEDGVKEVAV